MKKYLLFISNHDPDKWGENQKAGWDKIVYIPFPEVPADANWQKVEMIANELKELINEFAGDCFKEDAECFVNLQGEFSLCYILYEKFFGNDYLKFAFPTTERRVIEKVSPEGVTIKTAVFEFKRWRYKGDV